MGSRRILHKSTYHPSSPLNLRIVKPTLISAILALLLSSLTLSAADLSDLTYETTGLTVSITNCAKNASGDLAIPATIEGKPVTSIGYLAFRSCTRLTNITIPESVTQIEALAFSRCDSLTSLIIPNSVTSLGKLVSSRLAQT